MANARKNAFNSTSYSNLGDIRNGVPTGTSSSRSHAAQPPGNPATNGNGDAGCGSSAFR